MAIPHFRRIERRRSSRVTLTVPLIVRTGLDAAYKFRYKTWSRSVSGHGALIEMDTVISLGETLFLVNENSGQSAESRVASVRRAESKTYVGVEFVSQNAKFWHMTFPMPGARPLRRAFSEPPAIYKKVAAEKPVLKESS